MGHGLLFRFQDGLLLTRVRFEEAVRLALKTVVDHLKYCTQSYRIKVVTMAAAS